MLRKKIVSLILAVFFAVGSFLPQTTYALGPVTEVGPNVFTNIFNTGQNIWQVVAEDVLKPIAIGVADQMLSKLSTDVINWANNGFDGQPGFINNYEELIRGVEFDSINSSFQVANSIAQIQTNTAGNNGVDLELALCEADAFNDYQDNLTLFTEPQAEYEYEYDLVQCQIDVSTNESVASYTQCVTTNEQAAIDYSTQIMTGPSQQFFDDFYGGDASINSPYYADLTSAEQLEVAEDAGRYYEFMYQRNQCFNNLVIDSTAGDPGQTAQNNWDLLESGNVSSSRAVAETVANFGVEQFNNSEFEQIAAGGADLTLALLGSQSRKDDFVNDITAGGWDGILSLTGEGSTEIALTNTVRDVVSGNVDAKVAAKEAVISLPTQILSKTECEEYKRDPVTGDVTDECLREVTSTPGDIVAGQLTGALQKDQDSAGNFGDSLVSSLVSSLGNIVGGLVDQGLGELSSAAGEAFFSNTDTQNLITGSTSGGDFQSQYNVLGIEPSTSINIDNNGSTTGGSTGGGLQIPTGIGGPEDENVQIIIDFKSNLENAIDLALEEKSYYDQMRDVVLDAADVIYELEKCIPGPDYDWEERLDDSVSLGGNGWTDEEKDSFKTLAINEMKQMVQDPAITIPGAIAMRDQIDIIFNTSRDNKSRIDFRRNELTRLINTLQFIKNEIISDFNEQRLGENPNLVLFVEDWETLGQPEQESAFQYAVDNGYALLQGQSVTDIVTNDNERARNAVLDASWDIWRNQTDPVKKLELRQSYYTLQNSLSNEQFITIARTLLNEISSNITNSYEIAMDCLSFKSYAMGAEVAEISLIVNNENISIAEKIVNLADTFIDIYEPPIPGGIFGGINEYNTTTTRTDAELVSFIQSQANLQNNPGSTTLLKTPVMTSSFALSSSLLGFDTEQDKQDYFDTYYDTENLTYPGTGNFLTVKELYANDRYMFRGRRGGRAGPRTTVFCRLPGKFDMFGSSSGGDDTSVCFINWSAISKLDIEVIVSDISS
ncbi:MAG: hypothetical protein MRY57_03975 [Candidatus Pacebacteria bacterium]|nr:hypothetical protein [Candidatus Paceibacterota bacterium]